MIASASAHVSFESIRLTLKLDVAQGPVLIDIPPGAIVGLLDDFWQRSLVDVGPPGSNAGNADSHNLLVRCIINRSTRPAGWDGVLGTAYDNATRAPCSITRRTTPPTRHTRRAQGERGRVVDMYWPTAPAGQESNWIETVPGRGSTDVPPLQPH